MKIKDSIFIVVVSALIVGTHAKAQELTVERSHRNARINPADPGDDATGAKLERDIHSPLPEQYITTTNMGAQRDVAAEEGKYYFRRAFDINEVPKEATLYVAGPRWEQVWINGHLADRVGSDRSSRLAVHVFATDVAKYLRPGKNILALEVTSGPRQMLVAKIVPAARGMNNGALLITDAQWMTSEKATDGWEQPDFSDASWEHVQSLGGIESSVEFFQWNRDAGMYDWPGYDGISSFLAHKNVVANAVMVPFEGRSRFENLTALTGGAGEFTVRYVADINNAPSLLLDFGREVTGRVQIDSDSDTPVQMTVQYGESESEAVKGPYLGVNPIGVPAHGTGYGPKTAFQYVKLRFIGGPEQMRFKSIHTDYVFYPVKYEGSFESSDPKLNAIWRTGAYTAHLCMQDGLWDASKRDRGRWSGDNDISARVIDAVFGDRYLVEDTEDRLLGATPVTKHVNNIPGYSTYWLTTVAEYYRHTGSKDFLLKIHDRAVQLLSYMDTEFDESGLYVNKTKAWPYVDWSPELDSDTPEARRANQFEFYRGYRDAAWLLREMGDTENADKYQRRATALKEASNKYLLDASTGTYGSRWQTNAMAVLSGTADPEKYDAIWKNVLSQVGNTRHSGLIISPYYNYYVISAMAKMGHGKEALGWIKAYWGGMLDEGATSFWEAYDPDWYKTDFHASLQADGGTGYFVSLAHGWSSGPTAWLMEEVLGIHATGAGFSTVDVRPDLMGLAFARGGEPTPRGTLKVDVRPEAITVDVPEGVIARVFVPMGQSGAMVRVNGKDQKAESGDARGVVTLTHAGHYRLEAH